MIPYLVEALGTFIFLSVIVSVGKPIPIAIALGKKIYFLVVKFPEDISTQCIRYDVYEERY